MLFFDSYIAIIGDIKNSKKITNRKELQNKLKQVLDEVNSLYSSDISSNFTITLGDEFQGLLKNGANVMNIIQKIEKEIYPIKIRLGIGIGEITTEINRNISIGADGPAYYKAREAVNSLKDIEKKRKAVVTDIKIEIDWENKIVTDLLNTILSLITVLKNSWTIREREAIWDMFDHRDSQTNIAGRLNISQPAVQKLLSGGKYYTYQEAINTITLTLSEIRRENV